MDYNNVLYSYILRHRYEIEKQLLAELVHHAVDDSDETYRIADMCARIRTGLFSVMADEEQLRAVIGSGNSLLDDIVGIHVKSLGGNGDVIITLRYPILTEYVEKHSK